MAICIFSRYKTLQIVTQQRWLSNLRDFTFLISLSLSQIDQESWDETIWESVHKLLNGHNVSNHSIAGPSSHDFCFPWHNALPAIDRQSKPAGDDGAGWKSHEVLVATPSLPTDKVLCGHSVTCFGGLLGCKGENSKMLVTARDSIGKNIICNASHTWNQVKRRHTKGTDSSFAKRMKSTGIPKEFLGTLVSCASFTHSTAIQIAVPKKTTKIKAVKACRRANSTTGG